MFFVLSFSPHVRIKYESEYLTLMSGSHIGCIEPFEEKDKAIQSYKLHKARGRNVRMIQITDLTEDANG